MRKIFFFSIDNSSSMQPEEKDAMQPRQMQLLQQPRLRMAEHLQEAMAALQRRQEDAEPLPEVRQGPLVVAEAAANAAELPVGDALPPLEGLVLENEGEVENGANNSLTLRLTPEEDWARVHAKLLEARALFRRSNATEKEVFEELDRFLRRHGEEGRIMAGDFVFAVQVRRAQKALLRQETPRLKEEIAAAEEERRAEEKLREFRERTALQAALLQKELLDAQDRRAAVAKTSVRIRYCPVCKMPGVARGRECPNRHNHPGYQS